MKKIILLGLVTLGLGVLPGTVVAWDDCPFGLVDDPYPGNCPRYVDTDGDDLCDHSQLAPEDRESVEVEVEVEVVVEPVIVASESPEKKPIKKLLPVIKLVLGHLAGILVYVWYRKRRSEKV